MIRSGAVQIAGRLSYREAIERFYARHPSATQEQVRRATGAPKRTVQRVYDALVRAGALIRTRWLSVA